MTKTILPVFYSFRRCPYAMRARLAIAVSGVDVEHREILLKNKPAAMLEASPKGTVPVLMLSDGRVIDESFEIMEWALAINDSENWLAVSEQAQALIQENDQVFKKHLDQYKYADRFPEHPQSHYRELGEGFLNKLEQRLQNQPFLMGSRFTLADAAIAPFIRQFAHVDRDWFFSSEYKALQAWLNRFLESELFINIMKKHPVWEPSV